MIIAGNRREDESLAGLYPGAEINGESGLLSPLSKIVQHRFRFIE